MDYKNLKLAYFSWKKKCFLCKITPTRSYLKIVKIPGNDLSTTAASKASKGEIQADKQNNTYY